MMLNRSSEEYYFMFSLAIPYHALEPLQSFHL